MQSRSLRVALLVAAFLAPSCGQPAAADIGTGYRKEYRATVVQKEPRTPRRPRQAGLGLRSAPKPVAKAPRAVRPVSVKPERVRAPVGSVPARIAAAWPGDDRWALRVSKCESSYNVTARRPGSQFWGLFQMGRWARSVTGWTLPLSQASVEYQTAKAWKLYQGWGPSQWECS